MTNFLLNKFIVSDHVKKALIEDIGYGDISTDFLCDNNQKFTAYLKTREDGIFCGELPVKCVFELLEGVEVTFYKNDGDEIKKGDKIAKIEGLARSILTGERLALNYAQKMSAIATLSNKYKKELDGFDTKIVDTRKNTPNFRMFEKYAILTGGASLHRFNLSDCVMLKDNHIALCNGSIKDAVNKVRKNLSHAHKIEVECDNFSQVIECCNLKVDIIMLDNMDENEADKAIKYIRENAPNTLIEASGGIKFEHLKNVAKKGVDIISTSALISPRAMDLGLDFEG